VSAPDRGAPDRGAAFAAASVPENYDRYLAPVVFAPWARLLLEQAAPPPGGVVLDVASGTGVVARLAALRVGPAGRVVASDISQPMVDHIASRQPEPGAAAIETSRCSAMELPFDDATFDTVLCQQGLQFMPDRALAVRQMRRVTKPGGVVGIAVWAGGHRHEPFQTYGEALDAVGADPPFPNAYDGETFRMSESQVRQAVAAGGLADVRVDTLELVITWPDAALAVRGIAGTPFGPVLAALDADQQAAVRETLTERFTSGGPVRHTTHAVLAVARA
jgi:SAM-dependent methyltransferase